MEKKIGMIIGIVFGILLIVVAAVKPAFLWNHDLVMSLRKSFGEALAMVFLIVAGIVMIGTSLLMTKGRAR